MTFELMELAVNTVRDYLMANFPAYLSDVQTEFPSLQLDPIASWYLAEKNQIDIQPPAVYVIGHQATGIAEDRVGTENRYGIVIAVQTVDNDSEHLRLKMYRYTLALWRCMRAVRFGGPVGDAVILQHDPGVLNFRPIFAVGNQFWMDAQLQFEVNIREAA